MKLGFLTACMPERSLEEIAAWAGGNGYEALELAAWPAARRSALHGESRQGRGFRRGRAAASAERARRPRPRRLGARVLRQRSRPGPRGARGDPRASPQVHRHSGSARRRASRDVHRARPRAERCGEPARRRTSLPPLVDYAGERGVRLMIENCVMEGWHPDGYPGNLAYSPELWEWMFSLGLYLTSTRRTCSGSGSTPSTRCVRTSTGSRTRTRRTPRSSRANGTGSASSDGRRHARRTRGTWAGGGIASRVSARSTSPATSTLSTKAASTASSRSSTRIRCGAARPSWSRRACEIAHDNLRGLVVR